MNKIYTIFDKVSGRVLGQKRIPKSWIEHNYAPTTQDYVEGEASSETMYVNPDTKEVVVQAALSAVWDTLEIAANGTDTATLSDLPMPCTVFIDGSPTEVIDGSLEFSATSPGNYHIMIDEVQYLKEEWVINVN